MARSSKSKNASEATNGTSGSHKASKDAEVASNRPSTGNGDSGNCFSYPKGVYFCLGNEFCERFSYYGMRSILTVYLLMVHRMPEQTVKLVYHFFVATCYFTPILGSVLADGFLGRFRVILYVSITYCIGHLLITLGAIPSAGETVMKILDFTGLFVIAVSTGGIKPCVSAFAADQFPPDRKRQREQFFSFFYFMINCGALLSNVITPILRRQNCLGNDHCFPLAFGVPAILMFLALVIFVAGKASYVMPPRAGNVIGQVFSCTFRAIKNRRTAKKPDVHRHAEAHRGPSAAFRFYPTQPDAARVRLWTRDADSLATALLASGQDVEETSSDEDVLWRAGDGNKFSGEAVPKKLMKGDHWLYAASDKYDDALIEDIRGVFRIIILFIPVVGFWALFDQQGSSWVIQANLMNGRMGRLTILPEQIGSINPLLVILLVPVFELIIYPTFRRCGLLTRPLQRMGVGGILAAASFVVVGFLQLAVGKTALTLPQAGFSRYTFLNLRPENVSIFDASDEQVSSLPTGVAMTFDFKSEISYRLEGDGNVQPREITKNASRDVGTFVVFFDEADDHVAQTFKLKKAEEGNSSFVIVADAITQRRNISMADDAGHKESGLGLANRTMTSFQPELISSGLYSVLIDNQEIGQVEPSVGGVYGLVIYANEFQNETILSKIVTLIEPNSVPLALQVIPYIIITVGEIMFSISGLEFSYSQAAPSMKSVLQAIWLITVACGNVIDMIISGSHLIEDPATEFFVYAGLMAATIAIFIFLAWRYKYVDRDSVAPSYNAAGSVESVPDTSRSNLSDYSQDQLSRHHTPDMELVNRREPSNGYGSLHTVEDNDVDHTK